MKRHALGIGKRRCCVAESWFQPSQRPASNGAGGPSQMESPAWSGRVGARARRGGGGGGAV